jgi:hypothetical protein
MEVVSEPLPRSNTQLPPSPNITPTPTRADNVPVTKDMAIGSKKGTVRLTIDDEADDTAAKEASTHSSGGSVKQGYREETGQQDTARREQARPQEDGTAAEPVPPPTNTDQGHQEDVSPSDHHSISEPDDDYKFDLLRAGGDYEGLTPAELEESHLSKEIAKGQETRAERKEAHLPRKEAQENAEKEAEDRRHEADTLAIAPAAASRTERQRVQHEQEKAEVEGQAKQVAEEARIAAENAEKYQSQKGFIKAVLEGGLPSVRSREAAAAVGAAPALHLHPVRRIVNASSIEFEKKCAPVATIALRCDAEQQRVIAVNGNCTQHIL